MLECYFDDSGTHDGSSVMVWGGVLGHSVFFDKFENAWKERLNAPCEGKPPVSAFHSTNLMSGSGEFRGYNRAESDRSRYLFREVIENAGLTVLSFGISVNDWERLVPANMRHALGDHERALFGMVIKFCCEAAKNEQERCSLRFDLGRKTPKLDSMILPALEAAGADPEPSIAFISVRESCALQAADLVAHETYRFFDAYAGSAASEPEVHLKKLFRGAHDAQARWLGPRQISEMVEEIKPILNDPFREAR